MGELRRDKILATQKRYWVGYGHLIMTSVILFYYIDSFTFFKSLIPTLNPYYLDPLLQRIDIALHLGVSPTQWATAHFPQWLLKLIANTYLVTWGAAMASYLFWQLCAPASRQRTMFISTFIMVWFYGGIVAATALSSVGPIYYSLFYNDAYSAMNAGIVETLSAGPQALPSNFFLDVRQMLLDFYNNDKIVDHNIMSAMPSMHTATTTIIAIHSYFFTRWLRFVTVPYAVFIFVGSFALGWHYAIDTYVSIIIVAAIWQWNRVELRQISN